MIIKSSKIKKHFNLPRFFQNSFKSSCHPRLNLLRLYNVQLRRWFDGITSHGAEMFKKHNFGNVGSLLKVKINWSLIEGLVPKWDTIDRVFWFGAIDNLPNHQGILLDPRGPLRYRLRYHSLPELRFQNLNV